MPRKLANWVDSYLEYTDNSEPPLLYKTWVAISVIASVLQRKCYLPWDRELYPNMYIVLVGPSGKCRKGTAMYPGQRFLRQLGIKMSAEAITREALIRELRESNYTQVDPDTNMMYFHSSLTVYSKELTVFLGIQNAQLMSDLTDWYDCDSQWTYRTKNMGTDEIIGVWVNLIGATTPELIQSSLPPDAIGGGLASRIIFVYEEDKGKLCPAPFLTAADEALYDNLYTDLEQISMLEGKFMITGDFMEYYTDWYIKQQQNPPFSDPRFSGYCARRQYHALKLSIILSAADGDHKEIDVDLLKKSIALLEATEVKMLHTFKGMGESRVLGVTNRVKWTIEREGTITLGDLLRRHYHDADKFTLAHIVEDLRVMKFCETRNTTEGIIIKHIKQKEEGHE